MRALNIVGHCFPLVMFLGGLIAAGCGGGGHEPENATRAAIRQNRQMWQSRNVSSYRYTLRVSAFIPSEARGPVRIEVRDGVPVSIQDLSGAAIANPELFASCNTINKLFNRLEVAADEKAARQEQTFDSANGYPVSVYIDYDLRLADEEYGFSVSDFVPLVTDDASLL